jgi:hypothetical protein
MLKEGFAPTQITQVGCPDGTLHSNYAALTGKSSAWADFSAALGGLAAAITTDNPWQRGPVAVPPNPAPADPAPARPAPVRLAPARDQILIDAVARTVTLSQGWRVQSGANDAKEDS